MRRGVGEIRVFTGGPASRARPAGRLDVPQRPRIASTPPRWPSRRPTPVGSPSCPVRPGWTTAVPWLRLAAP